MLRRLALQEEQIRTSVDERLDDWAWYLDYCTLVEKVGDEHLGTSTTDELGAGTFARVERREFAKQKLTAPTCSVHLRCEVVHRRRWPRRAYGRSLDWSLDDLVQALDAVRRTRLTGIAHGGR